jgi:hypothetical protein
VLKNGADKAPPQPLQTGGGADYWNSTQPHRTGYEVRYQHPPRSPRLHGAPANTLSAGEPLQMLLILMEMTLTGPCRHPINGMSMSPGSMRAHPDNLVAGQRQLSTSAVQAVTKRFWCVLAKPLRSDVNA